MKAKLKGARSARKRTSEVWPEWPPHGIIGEKTMGRFVVDVEVANSTDVALADEGKLPRDSVRRVTIRGVIDPGASRLVLPASVVAALGLPRRGRTKVTYADRRSAYRDNVFNVWLTIQGRNANCVAIVEPKRDSALIGAIVLEDMDFMVDCKNQLLVPRDPDTVLSEIE